MVTPCKFNFNDEWLEQPKWSWVRPGSNPTMAKCAWCKREITIGHTGSFALQYHARGKQHKALKEKFRKQNIQICPRTISTKEEPDTLHIINATDGRQVLNYGMEVDDPLQSLSKEIDILQQCAVERADLCEATGNIKYVIESNTLRRIAEKKIQKLQRLKSC